MFKSMSRRLVLGGLGVGGIAAWMGKSMAQNTPLYDPLEARQTLASDPLRPGFHFVPPRGFMNDPNGVMYWEGQYHLFYQHNPLEATWGNVHWGHAVSEDLVQWRDLPIALSPSPNGPDRSGCWSGCGVGDNGVPTLVYTGATYTVPLERYRGGIDAKQVVCIATSQDGLQTFQKDPRSPVLQAPPNASPEGFRDPYIWQENGAWWMVIASGIRDKGAAVLLYRSSDLRKWESKGALLHSTNPDDGEVFETPSFFSLGGKRVLTLGAGGRSVYYVGGFKNGKFTPENQGILDYGNYYAPQVLRGPDGQRVAFAWAWEGGWTWPGRNDPALKAPGWAGVTPLPRTLSLQPDNTVRAEPVTALEQLRGERFSLEPQTLEANQDVVLPLSGHSFELRAEFDPLQSRSCGLKIASSADGNQSTLLIYDPRGRQLTLLPSPASRAGGLGTPVSAPLVLNRQEPLRLQVFMDASILEVFANGRRCLTARIYPDPQNIQVRAFARNASARLLSFEGWTMQGIW